jgi:HPr kinase/phosphorylase
VPVRGGLDAGRDAAGPDHPDAEVVGGEDDIDRTGLDTATRNVLGVEIPLITVPVAAGRDLTNVVEVAALNQRLKQMGHNAAAELDEKLKRALAQKD